MPSSESSPDTSPPSPCWPELRFDEWRETCATLHLWTQIVGKIRRAQMPWLNHSWHVTLYVTARGLTTGIMPAGPRALQIDFDFFDHRLRIFTDEGEERRLALAPRSVADFHQELFSQLGALGLEIRIEATPNELPEVIPFAQDTVHASYDADYAQRFWRSLLQAERLFQRYRRSFVGKSSPVHFFWGSFDLATTRFSGRPAPEHPGGIPHLPEWVVREAYSHELASCGFWPGNDACPYPLFYAYAYPEPPGYARASLETPQARYDPGLREFVLPYDLVRQAASPDALLLQFLQETYQAAAELGGWDRQALERSEFPYAAA